MGKVTKCIQMLQILRSGRLYKSDVLARLLQTNPRNLPEYRKELNLSRQIVESIPGKNGGYRLSAPLPFPAPRFTSKEEQALEAAAKLLEDNNPVASSTLRRLLLAHEKAQFELNPPVIPTPMREAYAFLEDAAHARHSVLLDLKKEEGLSLCPMELTHGKEGVALLAFHPSSKRMRRIPLGDIVSYSLSQEPFLFPSEEIRRTGGGLLVSFHALPSDCLDLILDLPSGFIEAKEEKGSVHVHALFPNGEEALLYCLSHNDALRVDGPADLVAALADWAKTIGKNYPSRPSHRI